MEHAPITGGEMVIKTLQQLQVGQIFSLVGNQISPILLHCDAYGITNTSVRHEQAAVHMADGWSQMTKRPGVAIVSSGPGFTNTITGITKAYMAQTPLVLIIGSVIHKQRDRGELQDMHQLDLVRNCVKWSTSIGSVERIPELMTKALAHATSGRRGPVVVEVPFDVLNDSINLADFNTSHFQAHHNYRHGTIDPRSIITALSQAKTPLLMVGDDAYYHDAGEALHRFVEATGLPVLTVNKGRGLISDTHENCLGNGRCMDGGFCNTIYPEADLIINVGVTPDYEMSHFQQPSFADDTTWIHLCSHDNLLIVPHEHSQVCVGDIGAMIDTLTDHITTEGLTLELAQWKERLRHESEQFLNKATDAQRAYPVLHPKDLFDSINNTLADDALFVLDGSNAMFWASSFLHCTTPGQLFSSPDGQLASIGTGLPLAIAAKLASPEKQVILYTGDGSFGFNIGELDTLVRLNIPLLIIIHNDASWGLCESTQNLLYQQTAAVALPHTSYTNICRGFGIEGEKIHSIEAFNDALASFQERPRALCLEVSFDSALLSPGTTYFNAIFERLH